MKRIDTILPGVCLLEPVVYGDSRGFFMETYNRNVFHDLGIRCDFVQDNFSRSGRGVLRGLHYQIRHTQAKLVRVAVGEVFDVAVDVRRGSPTFGRWVGEILSAENRRMLFIPAGFAHGFYVLSEFAEFTYKCSDYYSPADERGMIWNDPDVAIGWPGHVATPVLSARDAKFGPLAVAKPEDLLLFQGDPT